VASCFICAVVDNATAEADPIGVCKKCFSLACIDHGTRLKQAIEFKCALCLPEVMLDSAGLVRHDAYEPRRPGDRGGGGLPSGEPAEPRLPRGPGGSAVSREFESHAQFEEVERRLAQATQDHRLAWGNVINDVIDRVARFEHDPRRREEIQYVVKTSAPTVIDELEKTGVEVSREVQRAEKARVLDRELVADALGVASWAIGAKPQLGGTELAVDQVALIGDERVRFLVRYAVGMLTAA